MVLLPSQDELCPPTKKVEEVAAETKEPGPKEGAGKGSLNDLANILFSFNKDGAEVEATSGTSSASISRVTLEPTRSTSS